MLPATVIALEAGNIVTQVKTVEKDGYAAVQVGCRAAGCAAAHCCSRVLGGVPCLPAGRHMCGLVRSSALLYLGACRTPTPCLLHTDHACVTRPTVISHLRKGPGLKMYWIPCMQVGYKTCREDKITKPEAGHLKKAGAPAMKHLREFKVGVWTDTQPRALRQGGTTVPSSGGGRGQARTALLPYDVRCSRRLTVQFSLCLQATSPTQETAHSAMPAQPPAFPSHAPSHPPTHPRVSSALPQIKDVAAYEPGQQLSLEEMFQAGDLVDLAGTTIGKGFQGE